MKNFPTLWAASFFSMVLTALIIVGPLGAFTVPPGNPLDPMTATEWDTLYRIEKGLSANWAQPHFINAYQAGFDAGVASRPHDTSSIGERMAVIEHLYIEVRTASIMRDERLEDFINQLNTRLRAVEAGGVKKPPPGTGTGGTP